jgi:predicted NBD/HSP70 family sugar kinase
MTAKKILLRNKILRELYYEDNLSCVDLSKRIHKSFPITADLIEELQEANLLIENGYAPSTGGRRPITYTIQKDVMFLVSVAMDQFVTKIAIMDMQNNFVLPIKKIELPLAGNARAADLLEEAITAIIASSGIAKEKFIGIGIGMPGFVNVKKGVNYSYLQLLNNKSITRHIGEKTGIPVFIDNDSSLIALAEFYFGAARGATNAMVVNIGWGIGLGMILNGELFRGNDGFAGEFSHIPLFLNGKSCWCGKVGCLETETSLSLIIENARQERKSERLLKLQTLATADIESAFGCIIKAVQDGDQAAVALFSKAGFNIGKGVAVLIHILNPKKIILSGRGSAAGQVWLAPIQQALNEHSIPRLLQSVEIEMSQLGIHAELIGAAALVMENYEREHLVKKPVKALS